MREIDRLELGDRVADALHWDIRSALREWQRGIAFYRWWFAPASEVK